MDDSLGSGVGVLDKAASVLQALEQGPLSLAELVRITGLARPTAHRLAVALEFHRFVARDNASKFILGPRLSELSTHAGDDHLLLAANPVLVALRDHTGESAQLYRRQGNDYVCSAVAERTTGLRDSIPVGATFPMRAGSTAQVLLAWEEPERLHRGLYGAQFTATVLSAVRRRGWAQSLGEHEAGVASIAAPVRDEHGRVIAALAISGPVGRMGRQPGRHYAAAVVTSANRLSEILKSREIDR